MVKRCVAIGGVPGTGKTTLMLKFMGDLTPITKLRNLVNGHVYKDRVVLGDYTKDGSFKGTDTFSMAVQPEAEEFFKENKFHVVFEGDRIFNSKMLNFIQDNGYELLTIIIEAPEKMLKERYAERGSDQSEKFLSGRKTKYENIKNDASLKVYTAVHEEPLDTVKIAVAMLKFINDGIIDDGTLKEVKHDSLDDFFS
jgi:cytidylate kinase